MKTKEREEVICPACKKPLIGAKFLDMIKRIWICNECYLKGK